MRLRPTTAGLDTVACLALRSEATMAFPSLPALVCRTGYVRRARNLLIGRLDSVGLFDELVRRKRTLFAGDRRLIGEAKVFEDEKGEARVRVRAHEAPPKREESPQSRN